MGTSISSCRWSIATSPSLTQIHTSRSRVCSSVRVNEGYARLPCCHTVAVKTGEESIAGNRTYSGVPKKPSQSGPPMKWKMS